jgi:rhodanese-related sulfurtransferase
VLAAVMLLAAPVAAQEPDPATAPRIPMAEFKALVDAHGVLIVDVRDAQSFAAGHVPGARSLPLAVILEPANVAALKAASTPIVLYCA